MDVDDICSKCGVCYRYYFRKWVRHWKSGKIIRARNGKALRIRSCNCE